MKKTAKYIISYLSSLLVALVGVALKMIFPQISDMLPILIVLSLLPIILLISQKVLTKKYISKINQTKVADMNVYMLRHKDEAQKSSNTLTKKLQSIRGVTTAYTVLLWILGVCAAFLGGILYHLQTYLFYLCILYSGIVLYAVYSRIPKEETLTLNEDAICLSREEYPVIYSIADRAAKQLGCHGEINIVMSVECNAMIIKSKNKYFLQIGILLLNILSEEELFCIFLHEFSHVSDKKRDNIRETKYNTWITNQSNGHAPWISFVVNFFVFFDVMYLFNHMIYRYAASVISESDADCDMAKHGDPKAAASALLKLEYDSRYSWESGVKNEIPLYSYEHHQKDYLRIQISKFRSAIEERQADWDAMISREILANNATHPTLKMRLELLGITEAKLLDDNSSLAFRKETEKALEYTQEMIYNDAKDSYAKNRKEAYLDPLERITVWEQNGTPLTAENYADIVSDLKQLGKHEEAEALCDRAIKELNENSSAHAYFIKGNALLYRYDASGIDLLYHAIEKNHNYMEAGLAIIGTFCCTTGREKELLEYRERALKFAQKDRDENSLADNLSRNDRLTKESLPNGMLEDILSFILSVDQDIIQNIYLVRKTINEAFFTSAFIIHFYGGTDTQRDEIMHKIFRYLDTYPVEWQFSLFDYFEVTEINVEKIEGSLVYSKSNKKGA